MNYMDLLNSIPTDLKSKFRKFENLRTKLINNEWSNIFNEVCLNEQLMPNYTNLSIYVYICIHMIPLISFTTWNDRQI